MQNAAAQMLPSNVQRTLKDFVEAAREAFSDSLISILLYGSGAEGKLRETSDINLMIVLKRFEAGGADRLREPLRVAQAAVRLKAMFILESELPAAAKFFAVKFADIIRRRVVLYGIDPLQEVSVVRADAIQRLKQTLLNLTIRLRESYILRSLREEQIIATIAGTAGPLRSCAAALLELESKPAASQKEALEQVASAIPGAGQAVASLSVAREGQPFAAGQAAPMLFALIELAGAMRARADGLS
jgi:predicted nucleotidyltransferase